MNTARNIAATTLVIIALVMGVVAVTPAATLLLPYFEVDFTTHTRGRHLTEAEKHKLVDSYNAGHAASVGNVRCCCGRSVYDDTYWRCTGQEKGNGVLVKK